MTREEAIDLLKSGPEGVRKWNQWRKTDPPIPDLTRAKLGGADLSEAHLHHAQLGEANLSGSDLLLANLSGAELRGADLRGARLFHASLFHASLESADLSDSDLSFADLSCARLSSASLRRAEVYRTKLTTCSLNGTNFSGALCGGSEFCDLDLSSAEGLELIEHTSPSTIGIDTILRSRGKIPWEFLRGCGVPDEFIRFIPSLVASMSPVEFYSCFISYSHKDEEFCQRLHSRLRDAKLRVWFAPEEMKGGTKLVDQIDSAIRLHDKLLLVLSEQSMKSDWVATEIYKARYREKREGRQVLFPIRLCGFDAIRDWQCFDADSGKDMAREIREYFVPDFCNWKNHDDFEKGFERLLKDLRATEMVAG